MGAGHNPIAWNSLPNMVPDTIKKISGTEQFRPMAENIIGSCVLLEFERRIYCAKEGVSVECLDSWFLGYRCRYVELCKEEKK